MRAFRNAAAIALVLLAVASLAALAVASRGGSSRGDSGTGQYGAKQECRPYEHGSEHRAGSGCPRGDRESPH
jgi:opacity protein-like surface antigen